MTGVHQWGWGDGPAGIAFWGWNEPYSANAADGFIPVAVTLPRSVKGVCVEDAGKAVQLRDIQTTAFCSYPGAASVHQHTYKAVHKTDATVTSASGLTLKTAIKGSPARAEVNKRSGKAAAGATCARSMARNEKGKTVKS